MAHDVTPPESTIAVAFVVDASLSLAAQWHLVIGQYVAPMLKRLSESNPGFRFRMAFVSYGTADTRPTPLLCKRFFADFQPVTKLIKEEPSKLGVGLSSSGTHGMSALEGFVAAVEMFDTLQSCYIPPDPNRPPLYHIFHIASSPPDHLEFPQHNQLPELDHITWDTLPAELQKRNINLSIINLDSSLTKFSELQSSAASGQKVMPWFPVRPQHALCLSGFPVHQAAPPKTTPQKRPHEVISVDDKSPDAKRVRLSQSSEKPAPTITVAPTRPPPPSQPVVANNPIQPPPQNMPPQIPVPGPQQLLDRFRQEEAKMRELNKAMVEARGRGEIARAEAIRQEMSKRIPQHQKLRQVVFTMLRAPQMAAMRQQLMQGQLANQGNAATATANPATETLKAPQGSSPAQGTTAAFPPNDGPNPPTNNFVPPQGMHIRSVSNPGEVGQGFNAARIQMSPSAAAQMQKVIEQQNRTGQPPPQHLGVGPSKGSPNMMVNMPPSSITSAPPMNMMSAGDHPPSNAAQPPQPQSQPSVKTPVWQGTLRWSGVDSNGKREMQVHVVAFAQNPAECHANTWPSSFMLTPTAQPAVSTQDLQVWVKKTQPALCTFAAQPRIADPKTNELHYRSLIALLLNKKVYAIAAWTRPSGAQDPNALLFPINAQGLVGAFFPLNGIPELPKSTNPNSNPNSVPPNFPIQSNMMASLAKLPPEQRNALMAQFAIAQRVRAAQAAANNNATSSSGSSGFTPQQPPQTVQQQFQQHQQQLQQHQQHQQQQQQQASQQQSFGAGQSYPGAGMVPQANNMMNFNAQQTQMSASLPRPVQPNVQGGFSHEILQSFMQRSAEGGGGT
ncbi:hypothetical protein DFS33DRAFT_1321669 [Desarmillaria ectypa]|nr:hypothetical protein DFS33DRAFT_1321669 [Desarmillaria ectypa]